MTSIIKIVSHFLKTPLKILLNRGRFVRLSQPNAMSKIRFFDNENKSTLEFYCRNKFDAFTVHEIFGRQDYNLTWLKRYSEIKLFYESLRQNNQVPLIVDCGANIGVASSWFSVNYPASKIISVEPDSNNFKQAHKNTSPHDNIHLLLGGISSSEGFLSIENTEASNPRAFQVRSSSSESDVKKLTINGILSDSLDEHTVPFIIKIDIEGFENDLFERNTEWIDKFPLIIIELHDWMLPKEANARNFLKEISKHNRDFVFKGENVFSISNDLL